MLCCVSKRAAAGADLGFSYDDYSSNLQPVELEKIEVELYPVEDVPPILLPCAICARTFMPQSLEKHSKICERSAIKKRKPFDSAKQRIQGTELAEFLPKQEKKRHFQEDRSGNTRSSWKQTHDDFLQAIRAARGETRQCGPVVSSGAPTRANEKGACPTCNRQFGIKAYDRHVAWCKERSTRLPVSAATNIAKERLEARMKYRAPALKNRRPTNREKYSPGSAVALNAGSKTSPTLAGSKAKESLSMPSCHKGGDSPLKQKPAVVRRPTQAKESVISSGPMKSRPMDRTNRPAEDEPGPLSFRPPNPPPLLRRTSHFPVPRIKFTNERSVETWKNNLASPKINGKQHIGEGRFVPRREMMFLQRLKNDENKGQTLQTGRSQRGSIVSARSQGNPKVNDVSVNDDAMGMTVQPCTIYKEKELVTWKQISREKSVQVTQDSGANETKDSLDKSSMFVFREGRTKNLWTEHSMNHNDWQGDWQYESEVKEQEVMSEEENQNDNNTDRLSIHEGNNTWENDDDNLNRTYSIKDQMEGKLLFEKDCGSKKRKLVMHSPRIEFRLQDSKNFKYENVKLLPVPRNRSKTSKNDVDVPRSLKVHNNKKNDNEGILHESANDSLFCVKENTDTSETIFESSQESFLDNTERSLPISAPEILSNDKILDSQQETSLVTLTQGGKEITENLQCKENTSLLESQIYKSSILSFNIDKEQFDCDKRLSMFCTTVSDDIQSEKSLNEKCIPMCLENKSPETFPKQYEYSKTLNNIDEESIFKHDTNNIAKRPQQDIQELQSEYRAEEECQQDNNKHIPSTFFKYMEPISMNNDAQLFDSNLIYPTRPSTPINERTMTFEEPEEEESVCSSFLAPSVDVKSDYAAQKDTLHTDTLSDNIRSNPKSNKYTETSQEKQDIITESCQISEGDGSKSTLKISEELRLNDNIKRRSGTYIVDNVSKYSIVNSKSNLEESVHRTSPEKIQVASNTREQGSCTSTDSYIVTEEKSKMSFESVVHPNIPTNEEIHQIYENYVNTDFDYDSDNTFGEKPDLSVKEKVFPNSKKNMDLEIARIRCKSAQASLATSSQLNSMEIQSKIRQSMELLRGSTDTLISSIEANHLANKEQSSVADSVEEETIELIGSRNRSITVRILPEIKCNTLEAKESQGTCQRVQTYWEKASNASRRRLINLDPPIHAECGLLKRNPKARILPPVPTSFIRRSGTCKDYDPFLLAEQQMNDLLSDTSDRSMTDSPSTGQTHENLFPLSHSSAFVKYPHQIAPSSSNKRSSLIAPPTEFDDLTSDFSSDSTETNSLSHELFLKDCKEQERAKDLLASRSSDKESPPRELGRRVIIDKSKALGGEIAEDRSERGSRSFVGSSEKARRILDKVSPKVVRPNVNRSHSVRASSAPKTTPERKTSGNGIGDSKKASQSKVNEGHRATNGHLNSRNNNYVNLSGSNLSLSSIVSSELDMKRSNSVFDELMSSFEDDGTSFPSLRNLLKNDSLSMSSPVHGGRQHNGQISDEEFSSPDSYKRQDHGKFSADSAYSSLNRKYSNHGRSTNDVAGRFDEEACRNRRNSDTAAKCKMSKFCHECGSKFPETAKFCCECGVKRLAL
ncbi:hypothetical protein KM043_015395 [Ampulex compressa]|nr:hypothetical protein KM043_015395 [Ampulex compressa]